MGKNVVIFSGKRARHDDLSLEFHNVLSRNGRFVLRPLARVRARREPPESVIANTGSVVRTDPNIATSWAEGHGCGKSGNGYGLGTMGSTTPSRNISPRS
jgi:hypothetical protein